MLNNLNQALVDKENPATYTQAIIELGATLCTKSKPDCENCPVNSGCMAFEKGLTNVIPFKSKLKAKKEKKFMTAIMINEDGNFLVSKVTDNLLNGLYLLPQVEAESIQYAIESFESNGITVLSYDYLNPYKHIFTHLLWEMDVYVLKVKGIGIYQPVGDYQTIPIATAHKQIIIKEGYYGNI
jgi:A/G-specific adenine glycosylase